MPLEHWKDFFEIGGVTLLFLTFVFGAGALFTTSKLNKRQAASLRDFEIRLQKEQQKTAAAEQATAEAQLALRKYTNPRWRNLTIDAKEFKKSLQGKPTSKFEILYPREDEEAYTFALVLSEMLKSVGWTLAEIRPLEAGDALPGKWDNPSAPLAVNSGAWWGMSLNVKSCPYPPSAHVNDSPVCALLEALRGGQIFNDPRLPEGIVRIVLGEKQ